MEGRGNGRGGEVRRDGRERKEERRTDGGKRDGKEGGVRSDGSERKEGENGR